MVDEYNDEYNTDDLVEEIRGKVMQEQLDRLKAEIMKPVVMPRFQPEEISLYTDEYCYPVLEQVDDKIRITSYSVETHEGIKHLGRSGPDHYSYLPGSPYGFAL